MGRVSDVLLKFSMEYLVAIFCAIFSAIKRSEIGHDISDMNLFGCKKKLRPNFRSQTFVSENVNYDRISTVSIVAILSFSCSAWDTY